MKKCWKCNGNGFIDRYKHYKDGICFECNGSGQITESLEDQDLQANYEDDRNFDYILDDIFGDLDLNYDDSDLI
jgi:hypothetical protein